MISKENLEKYINSIKKGHEMEEDLNSFIRKHSDGGWIIFDSFSELEDCIVELIANSISPQERECIIDDISYYIYDLEYGTKWEKGMITAKDGTDIPMSNIIELYEYLVRYYGNKK